MIKLREFVSNFKKRLFLKLLTYILGLMVAILLIFSYSSYKIISNEYVNQSKSVNQSLLIQVADKIEGSISFVEEFIISASNNHYVVNAAIKPGKRYVERNANLLSYIKEIINSTEYISSIYVYEKGSNLLYSSKGIIEKNSEIDFIPNNPLSRGQSMLSSQTYRYEVFLSYNNDQIYLIHASIPIENEFRLFVVAELNKDILFKNAHEIYQQTSNFLQIKSKNDLVILDTNLNQDSSIVNNSVHYSSLYPPWDFSFYIHQTSLPTLKYYLLAVLPFAIILLAVTIFLAPYIAWRMYSPIWKLVQNVSLWKKPVEPKTTDATYINELDFLLSTYDAAFHDRNTILNMVKDVRTELEEHLLTNLINGVVYSEDEIKDKLRNIHSSCSVDDKYQVILAYPKLNTDAKNDVNRQIILYQLKELIQGSDFGDQANIFFLLEIDSYGAIVLCYPASSLTELNRNISDQLIKEIENFFSQQGTPVLISSGRIFNNLKDIHLSFDIAKENIRYQLYFATKPNKSSSLLQETDNEEKPEFEKYLEIFMDHIKRYEFNKVEEMLIFVLDKISDSKGDLSTKKQKYAKILDSLSKHALMFAGKDQTTKLKWLGQVYTELKATSIESELKENVHDAAGELLDFIKNDSIKKQNRRANRAKECIENNYTNPDLSADMIAKEIGISASYLSKIFLEYTGENLITSINSYRVDMAKELLTNTDILIRDVGFRAGFYTVQNFNRVFKKYVGTTPSKYRSTFSNS